MNRSNWIGETLGGRYRIQEILGQGGMSTVYKAFDPNLQRVVAIKLIHPHLSADPRFTSRFEEEARVVASLRNQNIVQVYDFNHDGDLYYMVQEYVPGGTLQSVLQHLNDSGVRMPLADVIKYVADVCGAIGYAHQFGMIHRDIKPANIMINERGQAILTDFGIVKLLGGEAHTTTGSVVGTVLYMSPELIRGETPDARSDIYSLGITLFEMLSGRPPFEANSAMTVMLMHQNDPVPDLHQLRPEVPEALIEVVEKALAKNPAERYQTASEMASALKQTAARIPGAAALAGDTTRRLAQANTGTTYPIDRGASIAGARNLATPSGGTVGSAIGSAANASAYQANSTLITSSPSQTFNSEASAKKKTNLTPYIAGGGMVAILLFTICLLVAGLALRRAMANGGGFLSSQADPSATPSATSALDSAPTTEPPTTPTQTFAPIATPNPALAFLIPTPPPGAAFVRIDQISTDDHGNYVVTYETFEFTEQLPGQHIHFFFNTVPQDQAGPPGKGPWNMYGGPRPFTGYKTSDRPQEATQICALVAEADHVLHPNSGNCYPLPDVTQVLAKADSECRFGPGTEYPLLTTLKAFSSGIVDGMSPDESWWHIVDPTKPGDFCWVATDSTVLSGDITTLKLVEPPPVPTGPVIGDSPFLEITNITIDDQNRYVAEYVAHNFTEQLPGTHIHFFFNTTPADQTGINGGGSRLMHGGPSPFSGYQVSDRPQDATELCALVANPDHSIQSDSGNCLALPDIPIGLVSTITDCYAKPDPLSDKVTNLLPQAAIKLLGITPKRDWVYVAASDSPEATCWIPFPLAKSEADLNQLKVIGSNPTPVPTKKSKDNGY